MAGGATRIRQPVTTHVPPGNGHNSTAENGFNDSISRNAASRRPLFNQETNNPRYAHWNPAEGDTLNPDPNRRYNLNDDDNSSIMSNEEAQRRREPNPDYGYTQFQDDDGQNPRNFTYNDYNDQTPREKGWMRRNPGKTAALAILGVGAAVGASIGFAQLHYELQEGDKSIPNPWTEKL